MNEREFLFVRKDGAPVIKEGNVSFVSVRFSGHTAYETWRAHLSLYGAYSDFTVTELSESRV